MARSRVTLMLIACLLAIFLTNNLPYVSGAITGGSSGGEGIRISKDKKGKSSVRLKKKGARQKAPGRVETPTFQPTAKETELMELTPDAPQEAPPPPPPECDSDLSLLQISEPPDGSTVQGSGFDVGVQIMPCNTDLFNASYANPTSRICLSLDDSPFYCWPIFGGKLRFINAVEGQHTLKAVLMKRGEMVDETASEEITFTTIIDPNLEEDFDEAMKGEEEEGENKENERVTLAFPVLDLVLPFERVTLPGSKLTIVGQVKTNDEDRQTFEDYFRYQFTCYNLDAATAHACWSIYGENSTPYVDSLEPGLHTLEGVITHPETTKGIVETSTPMRTFYTAGDNNEAASIVVEIEVDTEITTIPVAAGADAHNQGFYFCGLRGIEDESCSGYVAQKILDAWAKL